ncbi:aminotransferase class IV [Actinosynnema mirum]|uniref:Aminotransferase class IV n=1 Tax=Actinosynnema mirum (strain ATCC 29888 / DSM 43827 / JCM 3225 / NBRC 14064 / NCIMB 13271 / NRRL B-12336 / IMRU 3971 / 101) TaxID=446462 RepID=C6WIF7_ACTMD|nr:aminotransferase class IV [Actinosynnema mirum]ACU36200.1 aminotransferase class IV [Actinosynnema mirum DSM 43827]
MRRIEVDGVAATAQDMAGLFGNYGHFTAFQVRNGLVRGMNHHLDRLAEGNRELYALDLDRARVRALVAQALRGVTDASVRVALFGVDTPTTLVSVREPQEPPELPQSLLPVEHVRPLPHVKHLGGFERAVHHRAAREAGFDGALLIAPGGLIVESAVANIGFFSNNEIVWADGPWLHGTTMRLLEEHMPSRRAQVHLTDLGEHDGAFTANSWGVAPVHRIGDVRYPVGRTFERLRAAFAAIPQHPVTP